MNESIPNALEEAKSHAVFLLRFANISPDQLAEDVEGQRTILFTIVLLAQALNRLPPDVRTLEPEIPFQAIRGLRNHIVHAHWQIDFAIIAGILNRRIPELIERLDRLSSLLATREEP